tara:strand:+ start:1552 stop:5808 length:4257 start_codon:yes stop_codon:yes gene_type:complete
MSSQKDRTLAFIRKIDELLLKLAPDDWKYLQSFVVTGTNAAMNVFAGAVGWFTDLDEYLQEEANLVLYGEKQPEVFAKGGKYPVINEIVWNFLKTARTKAIEKEEKFLNENIQANIIMAVESYLEGQKFSGFFFGGKEVLSNLYDETIGDPFMTEVFLHAFRAREDPPTQRFGTYPTQRLTFVPRGDAKGLEVTDEVAIKIGELVIEKVKDGKVNDLFPASRTIEYVLENGYTIEQVSEKIADRVQAKINDLDEIEIRINTPQKEVEMVWYGLFTYKATRPAVRSFFLTNTPKNSQIYFTILNDPATPPKEVKMDDVPFSTYKLPNNAEFGITGISEDVTQWPRGPYGDNPEALELLERDKSTGGKDIREYEFEFYTGRPVSVKDWFKNLIKFEDPATPQELIKSTIENRYAQFILSMGLDLDEDGQLEQSALAYFNLFFDDDFITLIYESIAIDKELARRHDIFNRIADKAATGGQLDKQDIKDIETEAAKAFLETNAPDTKTPLTEEQIEGRQRFYKQCALMMNIGKLNTKFEEQILARQATESFDGPMKDKPFGGRFWRAKSRNKESLMTNLVSSEDSSYMFEIPPHVMTQLTPKFRLYKVMNDQSGTLKQTEFIFPRFTDLNRDKNFKKTQGTNQEGEIPSFLAAQFDKGDGLGLKSFSINFNGTNPAEARNDIKGEMSLFFQSFADFTRKRISNNGDEYRFVDLIIQPEPDDANMSQGVKITTLRQYEPTFYRIRVDMGYNIPKAGDIQGISSDDLISLQNALKSMNKSYYLCMIDHDFNIKNDGTVEMKFTYRAYLETALKSLRFDALTTPELARKRIENQNKLFEIAADKKCTKDELKELQLAIAGSEEALVLNSLNSIMIRMYSRGKIFNVTIDNDDRKFFLNKGYFKNCNLLNDAQRENSGAVTGDLGVVLDRNFLSEEPDVDFKRDIDDTKIQFFFFGDILHTILDALNDPDTRTVAVGMENTKIVLGSFDFDPYQSNSGPVSLNISNIPISVDFFSEWFKENVLNQKSSRRTFPILNFIRSLSNYVVSNALLETCVNRNVENALLFQTGQVSVVSSNKEDPLSAMVDLDQRAIIHTDLQRRIAIRIKEKPKSEQAKKAKKSGLYGLPLNGDTGGSPNVEDFYHYIVLNANGSSLTYAGKGKYEDDIKKGRFHVEIGSNRGIVKTVKFSKTNMQYLREARFMRNGVDGLLQLSSVYKASVEMFGNTLFYPGMELWINPYGFGGLPLGNPQQGGDNRSLANMLGLGGYHTITGVSTTLTPTGFTTSLDSQHYYSGDGEQPDTIEPKAPKKNKTDSLIEMGVNEKSDRSIEDANFCEAELTEALNFNIADANNSQSSTPSIETGTTTAATAATPAPATPTGEELQTKYPNGARTSRNGQAGVYTHKTSNNGLLKVYFEPDDGSGKVRITE